MILLLAPVLVPLLAAVLTAVLDGKHGLRRAVSLSGAALTLASAAALCASVVSSGAQAVAVGNWPLPFAIALAADGLSALLILVSALLGFAVMLFASRWPESEAPAGLEPLLHGILAGVCAVFLAADLFNLYVWFELLFVTLLGLLVQGGAARHGEAALKYLSLSLLGTLLMLAAVGLVYGVSGHLNFTALREAASVPGTAQALALPVALLGLAVLFKAGTFPLFAWLPASYHILPAPALALVGGLLTKVAAYVLLRLLGDVFVTSPAIGRELLGWLAVLTMLSGVLGAAYHWDLRRILAFHIVSQIGYLLLGIALDSPAGAAGSAFFLAHNILVKANLFLLAGLIWRAAGQYDLRRIGGLYLARPVLAVLFLLSALALVGVPPTSGFWGKVMLLREAFAQGRHVWAGIALFTGLLTLYSMSKIWNEAFWKPHPTETAPHIALPVPAYAAVWVLSLTLLALGLYPEPVLGLVQQATAGFGGTP